MVEWRVSRKGNNDSVGGGKRIAGKQQRFIWLVALTHNSTVKERKNGAIGAAGERIE